MSLEYNIAGPADDEDYAQAEYLAEMLMVSLPSINCNLLPILPAHTHMKHLRKLETGPSQKVHRYPYRNQARPQASG